MFYFQIVPLIYKLQCEGPSMTMGNISLPKYRVWFTPVKTKTNLFGLQYNSKCLEFMLLQFWKKKTLKINQSTAHLDKYIYPWRFCTGQGPKLSLWTAVREDPTSPSLPWFKPRMWIIEYLSWFLINILGLIFLIKAKWVAIHLKRILLDRMWKK